jgi:hypothetical protein
MTKRQTIQRDPIVAALAESDNKADPDPTMGRNRARMPVVESDNTEPTATGVLNRVSEANIGQVDVNIDLGKERVTKRQRMRELRDAAIADMESGKPMGIYKTALNMGITRNTFYAWQKDTDWAFYQGMIDWVKRLILQANIEHTLATGDKLKMVSYIQGYLNRIDPISSKSEQSLIVKHIDPKKLSNDALIDLVKRKKDKN